MIFVGNDWTEDHHVVHVMDAQGKKLAARRLTEGIEGIRALHALIGEYADQPDQVSVGIETDRGLWVNALVAAGYQVYAINPKAASRYRDRHHVGGGKSDPGDAKMLADLVRTDAHNHRQVAGNSPDVEGIKVIALAHQNLIWSRNREVNRLRNALRDYYPAALIAFEGLDAWDTLAVLAKAPDPVTGAKLTAAQLKAALRPGGRTRYLDDTAERIQAGLRTEQLTVPPPVAAAYAATTKAVVALLAAFNTQITELEAQLESSFEQNPDAVIYLSLPGLADVIGARVLGEYGDDPERFADAKSRRNYARHLTDHQGIGQGEARDGPLHPQQAPLRPPRPTVLLLPNPQPRRPSVLLRTPRHRPGPPQRATSPGQPMGRHPARLPQTPHHLRRKHRLGPPPSTRRSTS